MGPSSWRCATTDSRATVGGVSLCCRAIGLCPISCVQGVHIYQEFPYYTIMVNKNLCLGSDMDLHDKAMTIMEILNMEVTE